MFLYHAHFSSRFLDFFFLSPSQSLSYFFIIIFYFFFFSFTFLYMCSDFADLHAYFIARGCWIIIPDVFRFNFNVTSCVLKSYCCYSLCERAWTMIYFLYINCGWCDNDNGSGGGGVHLLTRQLHGCLFVYIQIIPTLLYSYRSLISFKTCHLLNNKPFCTYKYGIFDAAYCHSLPIGNFTF